MTYMGIRQILWGKEGRNLTAQKHERPKRKK